MVLTELVDEKWIFLAEGISRSIKLLKNNTCHWPLWFYSVAYAECVALAHCRYPIFPFGDTFISTSVGWGLFSFRAVHLFWCCWNCEASDSAVFTFYKLIVYVVLSSLICQEKICSYAQRRGINVLAELDVPGHALSW